MHQLVAEWVEYLDVELGRLPTTVERYIIVIEDFIAFLSKGTETASLPLESIGKKILRQFLRDYAHRGKDSSPSTWNLALAALRSFYGFLFEEEVIPLNPAHRIRRRKVRNRDALPLSLDEFFDLCDAMEKGREPYAARNLAIATVLFHCGLRVTELRSVSLNQVDLVNRYLIDVRAKGNKSLSAVLNDEAALTLQRYLRERHRFGCAEEESALFLSDRGQRISVRAVQEMVRTYAKRAGITRPVGPHLLRHSSATVLDEIGISLPGIQDHCNHESSTTTRRYIHVRDRMRLRTAHRLGEYVATHRRARHSGHRQAAAR